MSINIDKQHGRKDEDNVRINRAIRAKEVRLIGADGALLGVLPINEALIQAEQAGLDLVEVSPNAQPPVCKILDYGKFRYMAQKKAKQAKKNQKVINLKEIKVRPGIEQHDYEVKLKAAKRFIEDGDKVKFSLRFKGREMAHIELGRALMDRLLKDMELLVQVEQSPNMEGKQMIMIVAPK